MKDYKEPVNYSQTRKSDPWVVLILAVTSPVLINLIYWWFQGWI